VSLFDLGEECVETLAPRVFIFGQPGLEQTPEAKSAAHTQRAFTMRALVRLTRDRRMRISEAAEIHVREAKSYERGSVSHYLAYSELAASALQR
jgi:hypothetical protein